ncbi:hypothetical protein J3Q64DRAFT_1771746 [Phycomyces blakesleeanus]|uniref:Signal recognition particle subunit SRP72 n=2 Tax=Phycomyces blakesleeanus TaxID=4837 RepID=A0A162ZBB4_PHYB8|nr:hypothetical protein PHYBLDRAFT_184120 [Phycomyces blakesleeanus NRRL 1555(-)]OAD65591.1 hypothetical protein PHYBLDRAFT_184120 [Phycomyces blakesleeanus NRRL 1555(-)]|eukprot:XP_018283631.1 hypothetical protein PHYBLDRAFT_184120 [Phycomyces blakesleeanus NRRL 1555(-)]
MATTKEEQVSNLYSELKKTTDEYEDERSLSICDSIIQLDPDDQVALHCKVVTFIRLDKYTEALSLITRKFKKSDIDLNFEKLYCYYRTNQLQPALELLNELKKTKKDDVGLQYMEAQLLYAQDNYEASIKVYEKLLKSTNKNDRLYEEIQVNLLAAKAGLLFANPKAKDDVKEPLYDVSAPGAYEVAYNAASVHLARSELDLAREQLESARKQCNERMTEAGLSHEEIDEELAVIAAQLAYTYQVQGRTEEAKELYESVLNSKASDAGVTAIVSNNIVAMQETKDLFDAAKKLKVATGKEAENKLKRYQKRVIAMNESLLQLYMNKHAACRDSAQRLIAKYPDSDTLYLILAAATYHQSKGEKAVEELKKYAEKKPESLAIRFATIQLQLLQSQPAEALSTLESYLKVIDEKNKKGFYHQQPAVVALLVWLYEQTNQSEKAMETLDKASTLWKSDSSFLKSAPASIIKQTAAFKLKAGRYSEAAADYEQLVKADPTDSQTIAGLISAYAEIDPAKAEQYGDALPAIAMHHIDVDTLERVVPGVKRGYVKKDPKGTHVKKVKTKKKRQPLLPKNCDPSRTPDPERWLPKRERSTYRAKGKNKKAALRGPQGSAVEGGGIGGTGSANIGGRGAPVVVEKEVSEPKPQASTPSSTAAPSKAAANKKKNKKKGGKSKW